ncbi:MAG: UDP-N-acetylmuramate--L-alanine ligase, partial [Clostridia bacterium]|nr:UDP-N-acetylmuramate--L-alanine ligase [Clostridia bacterium]
MSALAQLLSDRGERVRGSDAAESSFTRNLRSRGIPVSIGDREEITEENVVYTGAIEEAHPQLRAARAAGKRLISRAELLGNVAEEYPHVISVSGCHGKASTTSMLSHVFQG